MKLIFFGKIILVVTILRDSPFFIDLVPKRIVCKSKRAQIRQKQTHTQKNVCRKMLTEKNVSTDNDTEINVCYGKIFFSPPHLRPLHNKHPFKTKWSVPYAWSAITRL